MAHLDGFAQTIGDFINAIDPEQTSALPELCRIWTTASHWTTAQ